MTAGTAQIRTTGPYAAWLCWALLLTWLSLLAHEFASEHAENEAECALCMILERLGKSLTAVSGAPPALLIECSPNVSPARPMAPAEILVTASRDPPALT